MNPSMISGKDREETVNSPGEEVPEEGVVIRTVPDEQNIPQDGTLRAQL